MPDTSVAGRLAAAIADREPVHWDDLATLAHGDRDRALLQQLRSVALLADASPADRPSVAAATAESTSPLFRVVLAVAAIRIAAALIAALSSSPGLTTLFAFQVAILVSFAASAVWLMWGAGDDERPRGLGHLYLLIASAFTRPLFAVGAAAGALPWADALARGPYVECFVPYALWRFARQLPRVSRFSQFDRASRLVTRAAGWGGALLVVATWWMAWMASPLPGRVGDWLWMLRRSEGGLGLWFWNVLFGMMVVALVASLRRTRATSSVERRRTLWFLCAFGGGLLPIVVEVLVQSLSSRFNTLMTSPGLLRLVIDLVVLSAVLSIPFTTAYAVLVHQFLPVRTVVGRTVRHAFGRVTLAIVCGVPAAALVVLIAREGERPLRVFLADPMVRGLSAVLVCGLLAVAWRRRLVDVVDRLLARTVDHPTALVRATHAISGGRTAREIAHQVAAQLEAAFDVSRVSVFARDALGGWTSLYGAAPPPGDDTALLAVVSEAPVVPVDTTSRLFRLMPPDDREWLAGHGFEVVARVSAPDRHVAGLLAIGGRRNVAYAPEDLALVGALASTAGLALYRPWAGPSTAAISAGNAGALECERCGLIGEPPACRCGTAVRPAALPPLLADRFRVQQRIGRGGMGVVYLGHDVRLDRRVALKTLPQVGGRPAERMLLEARAMARVDHPHLAMVYDVETWQGTPVLVVEYLPGGTLATRLVEGPLAPAAAVNLGALLADALAALHEAGILHRDIKPSNVGFTASGMPKLLDFGIASLVAQGRALPGDGGPSYSTQDAASTGFAGTPLYVSPEVLAGGAPDAHHDMWSLAVVILQALAGGYPLRVAVPGASAPALTAEAADAVRSIPDAASSILMRGVQARPRDRFTSASSMAAALRNAAAQLSEFSAPD